MNRSLFAFVFSFLTLIGTVSYAQISVEQLPIALQKKPWTAQWIAVPNTAPKEYGVYHFRKSIDLAAKPTSFIIHASDNRYKLFVNGQLVSLGPARSDIAHWHFETVDIASYLKAGKNTLAAEVWNFAESMPFAQQSLRTGFILQGDGEQEPSRSDCHAWGASPNIEFYRIVLGINTDAPGFSKVVISPNLGVLKESSGSIPHPKGNIKVSYAIDKKGQLNAGITLPEGIIGTFKWKGQERSLQGGTQELKL